MATEARLLGEPRIFDGQVWHEPPLDKRLCLLAYLACSGTWVARAKLAFLFWPDAPDEQARANLRQLLTRTKVLPFAGNLESDPTRLRWDVASDVTRFQEALVKEEWDQAVLLYCGDLLSGFALDDGSEFTAWLELERENLRSLWRQAVMERAGEYAQAARHVEAAGLLRRMLDNDNLDENILQTYLKSAALAGQRNLALETYERFAKNLSQDLGLEPAPTTQELVQALRDSTHAAAERVIPINSRNLPASTTPFIGRDIELTDILNMLSRPECQLLTLSGPGGIGKTRLALRVAEDMAVSYEQGSTFVALAAINDASLLPTVVANALAFSFTGQGDPKMQLLSHLRDKRMLLLLDNFEHLVAGASFVAELLETCPGVKLLVTSRERLNLTGEWLYPVGGMNLPQDDETPSLEGFDAVRLFLFSAHRTKPDFVLSPTDRAPLLRLCRIVGGAPLGIELAAGWLSLLSLQEIVTEVERNIDFLESSLRDLPERHRSLRVVFEGSWQLLAENDRSVLSRLAVFRGGFAREAVEAVAGASLRALLSLLEKSLLKRDAEGRFDLHELVRQYAEEKLVQVPQAEREARNRHCAYYTMYVEARARWLKGGERQQQALEDIEAELDNIRATWLWATGTGDSRALERLASLGPFYELRGFHSEGRELFERAASSLAGESLALCKLLTWQGVLAGRMGHLDESQAVAERSLHIYERSGETDGLAFTLMHLGVVQYYKGNLEKNEELHLRALEVANQTGDFWSVAAATGNLGAIATEKGNAAEAERRYLESISLFRGMNDRWGLGMGLQMLGHFLIGQNRFADASRTLEEALATSKEIKQKPSIMHVLASLSELAQSQGDFKKAEAYCLEAMKIARELGTHIENIHILAQLGRLKSSQGQPEAALSYFAEAIRYSGSLFRSQALSCVTYAAEVLFHLGDSEQALKLLAFASLQDLAQEDRERVARTETEIERQLPAPSCTAARAIGLKLEINDLPELLAKYANPIRD